MQDIVKKVKSTVIVSKLAIPWDLLIGLCFLILIVIWIWPLSVYMDKYIPGWGNDGGDGFIFLWDLWWVKQAIEHGWDIFYTKYLYYPQGVSLFFHTLILGKALIVLPFLYLFSLVKVFNMMFLVEMWLNCWCAYILIRDKWKSRSAGLIGAMVFGLTPFVMAHAMGHFNLTGIWIFPLTVWLIDKMWLSKSKWWSVVAGLVLGYSVLIDFQYAFLLVVLSLLYLLWKIWSGKKNWILVLIMGGTSFLMAYPILYRAIRTGQEYLPTSILSEISYWSADFYSWFTPSWMHPIWGDLIAKESASWMVSKTEGVLYLGVVGSVCLFLALILKKNKRDRNEVYFWLAMVLLFVVMAMGPFLKISGNLESAREGTNYIFGLPYLWLENIPFFGVMRVPARFFVLVILGVAVLSGWSVKKMLSNFGNKWRVVFLLFIFSLLIIDYSVWPMSMQTVDMPKVYANLPKDNFTILEVPLWFSSGHRSEGKQKTIIQYYQTAHEHPILNGSVSRVPDGLMSEYVELPGLKMLLDPNDANLLEVNKQGQQISDYWYRDLNVRYIVVHKKYFDANEFFNIRTYFENILGVEKYYEDEGEIAYILANKK